MRHQPSTFVQLLVNGGVAFMKQAFSVGIFKSKHKCGVSKVKDSTLLELVWPMPLGYTGKHYVLLRRVKLSWRMAELLRSSRVELLGEEKLYSMVSTRALKEVQDQMQRRRSRSPMVPQKTQKDMDKLRCLTMVEDVNFEHEMSWIVLKYWGDCEPGADHREGSWEPFCSLCGKWLDRVHRLSARHKARVRDHGQYQQDEYGPPTCVDERQAAHDAISRSKRQEQGQSSGSSIVLLPRPDLRDQEAGRMDEKGVSTKKKELNKYVVSGLQVSVTAVKEEPRCR